MLKYIVTKLDGDFMQYNHKEEKISWSDEQICSSNVMTFNSLRDVRIFLGIREVQRQMGNVGVHIKSVEVVDHSFKLEAREIGIVENRYIIGAAQRYDQYYLSTESVPNSAEEVLKFRYVSHEFFTSNAVEFETRDDARQFIQEKLMGQDASKYISFKADPYFIKVVHTRIMDTIK